MGNHGRRIPPMRSRTPVLPFLSLCLLVALLLGATAGWMVAGFVALTLLLGGLLVMGINARS